MLRIDARDRTQLIDPLYRAGTGFWVTLAILLTVVAAGTAIYVRQLLFGLAITGLQRPAYWGVYMVNFIFLIGVSMAGTLVSAALTLTDANWRRPITRIAEAVTVFGLLIAALQIMFDMGRPERALFMIPFGRLQSPLLWDMVSLSTYILASMFALYISLLPDLAILRDNYPPQGPVWRRTLYRLLALGWRGNRQQWLRLERVIHITSILIIPIGISLHTVTSWILSTTVQPAWHSTIMGPYFVVGAIFSGLGLLYMLLVLARRIWRLEDYIGQAQFQNLGWLLIVMSAVWFYFTYTEHLTIAAGQEEAEFPILASKLWGKDAPTFWGMVILMVIAFVLLVVPRLIPQRHAQTAYQPRFALAAAAAGALLLVLGVRPPQALVETGVVAEAGAIAGVVSPQQVLLTAGGLLALLAVYWLLQWFQQHSVYGTVIASACIVVGMWLERWNIIVPTLDHPHLIPWSRYAPTWSEWALMAASFALFALFFVVFFKLFPAVSIWEVTEGRVIQEAAAHVTIPTPAPSELPRRRRLFGERTRDARQQV
jgi:molybdopterin-containing oxidoreductase family membrane subunit